MSVMSYVSLTVRRADRGKIASSDLEKFGDFFDSIIVVGESPRIASSEREMHAYFEWFGYFEADIMAKFAEDNPDYQLEIIAESNDCEDKERTVMQGSIMETVFEERHFPDPVTIDWKYGE